MKKLLVLDLGLKQGLEGGLVKDDVDAGLMILKILILALIVSIQTERNMHKLKTA